MATQEDISNISDVAYLITRFRLADQKGNSEEKSAILKRFQELGMFEGEEFDPVQMQNLKADLDRFN